MSATVYEQSRPIGHRQQSRIALSYIKKIGVEFPVRARRTERVNNHDREQRRKRSQSDGDDATRTLSASSTRRQLKWVPTSDRNNEQQ